MSARRSCAALVFVVAAVGAVSVAAFAHGTGVATACTARQLRLSSRLSGATQSLLGTLTLTNRGRRACALAARPRRASLYILGQLLPTLTVRMPVRAAPPGAPTRTLPARGHVFVGVQWRNWCGSPRGRVRASLILTIYASVTPRVSLGTVTTPPCGEAELSSTVAVTRFLRR